MSRTRIPLAPAFMLIAPLFLGLHPASVWSAPQATSVPDLTAGGTIPGGWEQGWQHDWNLGPTGLRGWIFADKLVTTDARQIQVTRVDPRSPADGLIEVGDVILGAHGQPFDDDARLLFGRAITRAERDENRGQLPLLRWRNGETTEVTLQLTPMGSYSATAPFDCPKSKRIFEQGCAAIARKLAERPKEGHIITRALNATALLASGDPQYLPVLRQQAKLLSQYDQNEGVRTWSYAYVNLFLAEYVLATGDDTSDDTEIKAGFERITRKIVDGQSAVGSWGHGFVMESTGRLGGYGMMNAPGIPLTISLVLARRAGLEVPNLDDAIRRSEALLRFYVGKGAIPYGDHAPWIETHCDNGKCEMAAVLFDLEGDAQAATFFSHMAVASHGAERDTGHTGNFFNMTWALPGVVRSGPHASGAWLEEFGWYYDLARRWDGTFLYQGAPAPRREAYHDWDSTGAYLLGYAAPLAKIYLTGRQPSSAPAIDRATAVRLISDGQGWSNRDRHQASDALTTAELITRLSSWSPTVRERAAMALGRRQDDTVPALTALLETDPLHSRYGACQALKHQGRRAATAIPALVPHLDSDDLWLRILAAEAIGTVGRHAHTQLPPELVPNLLTRLTTVDRTRDPRGMEQRYLTVVLFDRRQGLLGRSLESVDRELLYTAVRAALLNDDGRARGAVATVFDNLTYAEIQPLLPAIHRAIVEPAPSGIMFADEIRTRGLELFARHHIAEGMHAIVQYARDQKLHGSKNRLQRVMNLLITYGAHAKTTLPQLRELTTFFPTQTTHPRRINLEKVQIVERAIETIQAATARPKLIPLNLPTPR